jgi:Uri superfamily endonuclease
MPSILPQIKSIYLTPKLLQRLNEECEREGLSRSEVFRRALYSYLGSSRKMRRYRAAQRIKREIAGEKVARREFNGLPCKRLGHRIVDR